MTRKDFQQFGQISQTAVEYIDRLHKRGEFDHETIGLLASLKAWGEDLVLRHFHARRPHG
jgi:hypothetical protein